MVDWITEVENKIKSRDSRNLHYKDLDRLIMIAKQSIDVCTLLKELYTILPAEYDDLVELFSNEWEGDESGKVE